MQRLIRPSDWPAKNQSLIGHQSIGASLVKTDWGKSFQRTKPQCCYAWYPSIHPSISYHYLSCTRGRGSAWSPCGEWIQFCLSRITFLLRKNSLQCVFSPAARRKLLRRSAACVSDHLTCQTRGKLSTSADIHACLCHAEWLMADYLFYLFINMCVGVYSVAPARVCVISSVCFPPYFFNVLSPMHFWNVYQGKIIIPLISSWFRSVEFHLFAFWFINWCYLFLHCLRYQYFLV